ncbi:MAG: hypothetical protein RLZZ444_730 [Pseudomonadota bacterium]
MMFARRFEHCHSPAEIASTPGKKSGIMRVWRHIKRRFWI